MLKKTRRNLKSCRGAAMIELALFLPVFFMITMATIETCRMLYVQQSLTIAAYECARLGIVPGVSSDSLRDQCDLLLISRRVRGSKLTVTPSDLSTLRYGDWLEITVEAPADSNALVGSWFYKGRVMTQKITIMAEY